jgi:hypothetical protein
LSAGKFGVTNVGTTRIKSFISNGWSLIEAFNVETGLDALDVESQVRKWIRQDLKIPAYLAKQEMKKLGGQTETYSVELLSPTSVASFARKLISKEHK